MDHIKVAIYVNKAKELTNYS